MLINYETKNATNNNEMQDSDIYIYMECQKTALRA